MSLRFVEPSPDVYRFPLTVRHLLDRRTRERAISAAKHTIGRVGTLVSEEAIQMHGGIGMKWKLPLSHYAKRLIMIDHQLGDEDHHLARFIKLGRAA